LFALGGELCGRPGGIRHGKAFPAGANTLYKCVFSRRHEERPDEPISETLESIHAGKPQAFALLMDLFSYQNQKINLSKSFLSHAI
jgi:hypothetical protein